MSDYDLVVVGSGAAGMTAALTAARVGLRAVVVEKAPRFGGSTARSGGGVWIPDNHVLRHDGARDTAEEGRAYVAHLVDGVVEPDRQHAFLTHGPRMLEMVCASTPLRLTWVRGYSDYYPEAPGGRLLGRSVEPRPMDARVLGTELARLEPPYLAAPAGVTITQADYKWLNLTARHPRGAWRAVRVGARTLANRVRGRRTLSMGQALVAGLRAGLADHGVPLLLDTPMLELVTDGGRVTGVRVQHDGAETVLTARGVVLASGGFEHNEAMRKEHQEHPIGTEWTVGAEANTGDGITAGQAAGGDVDLMDDAWWGPSIPLTGGPYFCLSERAQPGCILVNAAGERFVNESSPYVDAVKAMYAGHRTGVDHIPCWLVADQRYRNRYTFAGLGPRQPFPGRWYRAGVVHSADTVEALAERIGVPPDALGRTVTRFNGFAASGTDADFGRGDSGYDHYYGDPRLRANPSLAALDKAPFYAVRIVPGDLGTKGGLRTDAGARVLRGDGSAVPGLYAAGNASAAVMGRTYAGPGATLGPAMTFGYIAARTAAGYPDSVGTDSPGGRA
jgi:3-oxosteroid 1-dehydrogenase